MNKAETITPGRLKSEREESLQKYFKPLPVAPSHREARLRIIAGSTLIFFSLIFWVGGTSILGKILVGSAFFIGGTLLAGQGTKAYITDKYHHEKALKAAYPQPSDEAVDFWLSDALARTRSHSLEKFGLIAEDCDFANLGPICGPILWYKNGLDPKSLRWKNGLDGIVRFGAYSITFLWFAKNHLAIFTCDYDLIKDAILNEQDFEFFYHDIKSFSTQETASAFTLSTGQSLTSQQEFRIAVANGEYFSVTVGTKQLKELTGAERVPDSGAEKAIRAIRMKRQEVYNQLASSQ